MANKKSEKLFLPCGILYFVNHSYRFLFGVAQAQSFKDSMVHLYNHSMVLPVMNLVRVHHG
jgi:hypothetical protein